MPPKKKKPSTVVLGTVSTRSTRRESVVSIEIVPKTNKSPKNVEHKRLTRSDMKHSQSKKDMNSPNKTNLDILEILKDWSDDESSQNNIISINESNESNNLTGDQQSLIDILEGNQEIDNLKATKLTQPDNPSTTIETSKFIIERDTPEGNPIVTIDSPRLDEPEIIEECVVEDDSIIIELTEEQIGGQGKQDTIILGEMSLARKDFKLPEENIHISTDCIRIEETKSMRNQSLAKEGEYASINDILASDNSKNNIEVYEEQSLQKNVESGHPEENKINKTAELENREDISTNQVLPLEMEIITTKEKEVSGSAYQNVQDSVESVQISDNSLFKGASSENLVKNICSSVEEIPKDIGTEDIQISSEFISESVEVITETEVVVESEEGGTKSSISMLELDLTEDSQNGLMASKKVDLLGEEGQTLENILCDKIKESMQISRETNNKENVDFVSEKLQDGMEKMHIQEDVKNYHYKGISEEKATNNTSQVTLQEEGISNSTSKLSKGKTKKGADTIQRPTRKSTRNKSMNALEQDKVKDNINDSLKVDVNSKTEVETSSEEVLKNSRPKLNKAQKKLVVTLTNNKMETPDVEMPVKHIKLKAKSPKKLPLDENVDGSFENIETEEDTVSNDNLSKTNKLRSRKIKSQTGELNKVEVDVEMKEVDDAIDAKSEIETCCDINQDKATTKAHKSKAKKSLKKIIQETLKTESDSELDNQIKIAESELNPVLDETNLDKKSNLNLKSKNLKKTSEEITRMDTDSDNSQSKTIKDEESVEDEKSGKVKVKKTQKKSLTSKDAKEKTCKELKNQKTKNYKSENYEEVRRSDRIKTIVSVKKRSHGLVRSKSEPLLFLDAESSDNSAQSELDKYTPTASPQLTKKEKTKSKTKSSENLTYNLDSSQSDNYLNMPKTDGIKADKSGQAEIDARLKSFVHLKENQYKTDRQLCKEAQEMICDCYLAEEDIQNDEYGCGEDCLNRLLLIECGHLCQISERCTNKRFQKGQFAPVEVFKTEKKGLGLRAAANIPYGEFILEYIGEVLNPDEFDKRAEVYSKDKNIHFYFMSLRADAIIDATMKGNISRFINHSCDPNAETQKWTVNGELRIGFFSTRTILAGEEITFDYRFQRYGKEAQRCYCEAATCRGWLGERPDDSEEEEEEEEEEEPLKEPQFERAKPITTEFLNEPERGERDLTVEKPILETMDADVNSEVTKISQIVPAAAQVTITPKKTSKRKPRKDILYEDFDQLNEDIEMLVTTGLKNQAHTLKLSRLMVRAKDLEQRKKLLRILRRGELPCRRLFLDYHGLRLMHGYMIEAQQLINTEEKSSHLGLLQTKLELLQTLAVLPIQNKTMLIESKVLPAVEKWAKNEDLIEGNGNQDEDRKLKLQQGHKLLNEMDSSIKEKLEEMKFLASKLLEEWSNLKESFRIPKKQRIEQMKEHEKEANRKFMASTYAQEQESSRKTDQRYRTWSRYKSERETNKKGSKLEDKDKPSAAFLKISKHERRKLFALQMELKEEERRHKQRELWRQHELNCMMIGADPRFTAPFDPNKGFQYIWNPSIGQWQALPVPTMQNQGVYNSPVTTQGVGSFSIPPAHKPSFLSPYQPSTLTVSGLPNTTQQFPGMQPNITPMVPGIPGSVSSMTPPVPGITGPVSTIPGTVSAMTGPVSAIPTSAAAITQPPLPGLPMYQEVKQEEDPSQVKFAGPIPPPVKLPTKWKCAKDKYGRPYYYHVKIRKSQWEPPPLPEEVEEFSETSSSETSTLTSSESSSDSDTDDEIDDSKLLMEVRKQMDKTSKLALKSIIPDRVKKEEKDSVTPSPEVKLESDNEEVTEEYKKDTTEEKVVEPPSSIDIRLKEQFNLDNGEPLKKKRRVGLCEEIIISPRTEEDRLQFKEDLKRYKATKEKLKRQKEQMLYQAKKKAKLLGTSDDESKKVRDKRSSKTTVKSRIKEMSDWNNEQAKKIKEQFRSSMATTVVSVLNAYRKPDCKEARITNTEDFKHLARKLTHFVMLKEMKHIERIEDLECTDNVKAKAREYIKKYMSKFGEIYQKRQDEPDFKE